MVPVAEELGGDLICYKAWIVKLMHVSQQELQYNLCPRLIGNTYVLIAVICLFCSYQDPEPRHSRVHCDGCRRRTTGDHPPPAASVRRQERAICVCPLQTGSGPSLRRVAARYRYLSHHKGGISAQTTDSVCSDGHRETPRVIFVALSSPL